MITFTLNNYIDCWTDCGSFTKITFKQLRRKKDTRVQYYCKCYCAISVMGDQRCHINLFNDYTASIYVNGKCKHKHRHFFTCLGIKASSVDKQIFYSKCTSLPTRTYHLPLMWLLLAVTKSTSECRNIIGM